MNAPIPQHALFQARRAPEPVAPVIPRARSEAGPQDWEKLVSPGHVLGRRTVRAGKVMFLPALAVFCVVGLHTLHVAAGIAGFSLPLPRVPLPMISYTLPNWVREMFSYDPETYTDLQGGIRTSYRYAWLAKVPRSRGLSPQGWTDLVGAVQSDLRTAQLDTAKWTATPALATAPKVTRPGKALTEHVTRLDTGIVTVSGPGEQARVHVVAMVNGAWAWTTFSAFGCQQSFGPPVSGCVQNRSNDLNDLRPASN